MNSKTTFHSIYNGAPILRLKGLGSCMNGGSSWITCTKKFPTLKSCKEYIDSLPNSDFAWVLIQAQEQAKALGLVK